MYELLFIMIIPVAQTVWIRMFRLSVNEESEMMWKEMDVGSFKVLPQHLSGGTERNHEKPQSKYPTVRTRFKAKPFRI
jgi:hypothetical protein